MAATTGIGKLSEIAKDIGEVEFKHTLVAGDEDKLPRLFREALKQPQRRKVYFYDTTQARPLRQRPRAPRARDAGRG